MNQGKMYGPSMRLGASASRGWSIHHEADHTLGLVKKTQATYIV